MARSWFRRRDDGAAVEVVGFILTFAISSIVLVISMQSFREAQDNTDHLITGVEISGVADRVATRVLHAGIVAQEFPNATLTIRVRLAANQGEHPFEVEATEFGVLARLRNGALDANSTVYRLDAVDFLNVSGTIYSSEEVVVVRYNQTRLMNTGTSGAGLDEKFPSDASHVLKYITLTKAE